MHNKYFVAVLMLFITACSWGGMYHVAKATLPIVDAFWLTVIRCSFTALFFIPFLIWREGLAALRFEQHSIAIWWYGALGFAVFNYFVFFGLGYSQPEHGAIMMALMPLIAALIGWVSNGQRPPGYTLVLIILALAGVLLVVTRGNFTVLLQSKSTFGDVLILFGATAWVLYTRSAPRFRGWSSLRFTTLTVLAGTVSTLIITGTLTAFGVAHVPHLTLLPDLTWHIVYIVGLATIVAVLFWNQAIRVVGPINGVLFINLVPVSAFIIGITVGNKLYPLELVGTALILIALVANNLFARQQRVRLTL